MSGRGTAIGPGPRCARRNPAAARERPHTFWRRWALCMEGALRHPAPALLPTPAPAPRLRPTRLPAGSGDSGGPLFLRGSSDSSDVQVGIVSWGVQCGKQGLPSEPGEEAGRACMGFKFWALAQSQNN